MDKKISEAESALLLQLRSRLKDTSLNHFQNHDEYLVNWLRARSLNLNKAEEMFRNSLKWRQIINAERIKKSTPPEYYVKELSYEILGYDFEDSPVVLVRTGKWDFKRIVSAEERPAYIEWIRYMILSMEEHLKQISQIKNKCVFQYSLILDMSGFSLRRLAVVMAPVIEIHLHIIQEIEANFPETLKACYVANVCRFFRPIWTIIKPLLNSGTLERVHFYSPDATKWKSTIDDEYKILVNPDTK